MNKTDKTQSHVWETTVTFYVCLFSLPVENLLKLFIKKIKRVAFRYTLEESRAKVYAPSIVPNTTMINE